MYVTLEIIHGRLWVHVENDSGYGGSDYIDMSDLAKALAQETKENG